MLALNAWFIDHVADDINCCFFGFDKFYQSHNMRLAEYTFQRLFYVVSITSYTFLLYLDTTLDLDKNLTTMMEDLKY